MRTRRRVADLELVEVNMRQFILACVLVLSTIIASGCTHEQKVYAFWAWWDLTGQQEKAARNSK